MSLSDTDELIGLCFVLEHEGEEEGADGVEVDGCIDGQGGDVRG